jgi:hypothetical protein
VQGLRLQVRRLEGQGPAGALIEFSDVGAVTDAQRRYAEGRARFLAEERRVAERFARLRLQARGGILSIEDAKALVAIAEVASRCDSEDGYGIERQALSEALERLLGS